MYTSGPRSRPEPPDRGAFPLDLFKECKDACDKYLNCMKSNNQKVEMCRKEAKEYLECRMDKCVYRLGV